MPAKAQSNRVSALVPTPSDQPEEVVRFTLELPLSLHQALAHQAVTERTSRAAIIRRLLQESLQNGDA